MNDYLPPDPRDSEAPILARFYPYGRRAEHAYFVSPADHQVFVIVVQLDGPKVFLKECDRRGGFLPGGACYPADLRLIMPRTRHVA